MPSPVLHTRVLVVGASIALVTGCSLVMDADFEKYEAAGGAGVGGVSGSAGTGAGGSSGTAGTGAAGTAGGPCVPVLTINEVQTSGLDSSDDEFVELFNASDCVASLEDVVPAYRSSSATTDHSVTWTPDHGLAIAPWWFFVIGGDAFTGQRDSVLPSAFALGANGGGLALRQGGAVIDQLGWGDATNDFVDNIAAPAPASGEAIGRRPDGVDTNSNEPDFTVGVPSPGAPNPL
jgi:hypothetical protein